MATVATLTFDLVAQSASLRSELGKANRHTKKWADQTRKMVNTSAKAFAGMAVAGAAGLAAIYTQAASSADQLAKFSDKVGETPEKILALQHAAAETGVSVETTNMALQRMTRRTSEAARGTGEAVNAIKELGLDARDLAEQSPADQFSMIADAMKGVSSQGDRVRLSMKLFDSEGVALVNTLALGSKGLDDAKKEMQALGLELTRVDLSMIESANDEFDLVKKTIDGVTKQLAVQLAPIVEAVSNEFLNTAREAGGAGEIAGKAFSYISKAAGAAGDAVFYLKVGFKTIQLALQGVGVGAITLFSTIVKGYTELANLLPGIDIDYESTFLGQLEKRTQAGLEQTQEELNKLVLSEMPSSTIEQFVSDVQTKAREIAAKKHNADEGDESAVDSGPELSDKAIKLKNFSDLMESYSDVSAHSALYIEDSFASAFDSMTNSLSTGLASAIVEGKSLKDTLGQVAKTMAVDMVGGLIKVGAQMLVNAAFGKATQAEAVGSSIIAGNAIAAAYSTAAAFTSLASFGANGPPAQAAIGSTVGFSKALSLTGMAHDGISEVPKEGTWLLDKGERVLSSKQNDDLGSFMKEDQGGSVEVTNIFQISAGVSGTVKSEIEKLLPAFERLSVMSVEKAIKGGGSLARAVGAR